jgi:hypothetical protein
MIIITTNFAQKGSDRNCIGALIIPESSRNVLIIPLTPNKDLKIKAAEIKAIAQGINIIVLKIALPFSSFMLSTEAKINARNNMIGT